MVHVLTQKGRGYSPAEEDDVQRLHDVKALKAAAGENTVGSGEGWIAELSDDELAGLVSLRAAS